VAANLLEQNFVAHRPDQVWLADITYIPTCRGWLYLAVVLDLFTRKVVGWAMREHMRAELTIAALIMAIQRRRQGAGLIHHSDRGNQYAASEYRGIPQAAAITQSMSRKANCWDNAPMESFFGTLKTELVHHREYPDRDTARARTVRLYRRLLNRARIHSAIGYITPQQAEAKSRITRCPLSRGKVMRHLLPYRARRKSCSKVCCVGRWIYERKWSASAI